MSIKKRPKKGTTCPALYKEDYKYHLSGDAAKFCKCVLNDKKCAGRIVEDFDNYSSQFFSRAKCAIDTEKIKDCQLYGSSKEVFASILKSKAEEELEKKLKHFN